LTITDEGERALLKLDRQVLTELTPPLTDKEGHYSSKQLVVDYSEKVGEFEKVSSIILVPDLDIDFAEKNVVLAFFF